MAELQIFKNDEFGEVRTTIIEGEPYFVGKDIADILKYNEPHKAIVRHVEEEDRMKYPIPTNGGVQELWVINEPGLYSLILSSKIQYARDFKHWVTHDVLPAIRKQGYYALPGSQLPDFREIPLEALASYQRIQRTVMKDFGKSTKEIATEFKKVSLQFGINISDDFDLLAFEQASLF